ncbi:MAG: hypothetical protein MUE69_22660 [Myxococcota bacterium]|nr:hypothetical protein [Myxococcota bacterium]
MFDRVQPPGRVARASTTCVALALVLACLGCREPEVATQVLVHVDVEPAMQGRANALRLRVRRADAEPWTQTEPLARLRWPTTLPLEPRDGDATRRFDVEAELLAPDGTVLVRERALGGYVEGERRHVTLRLTEACEAIVCGALETCVEGVCEGACVRPTAARTETRSLPERCVDLDAGVDGGFDASLDAELDAELDDAALDADDAALDASEDAGPDGGTCAPVVTFDLAPNHLCVLLDGGILRCSGANGRGALGIGSRAAIEGFASPVAGGPWRELVVGERSTCALAGNELFCWGDDPGRLGLTDVEADTTRPQRVLGAGGVTLFRRASIGAGHGCAPRFSDPPSVYCFGRNDFSQSGGELSATLVAPAASPMLGSAFSVSAGDRHTCAIRTTTPSVVCWGDNDFGQLGVASATTETAGVPQSAMLRAFSIAAGATFTCALRDPDRRPVCFGDNRNSQCGASVQREVSRTVVPLDAAIVPSGIDAGDAHACVVSEDGEIWCWGSNAAGQLGTGVDAGPSTAMPRRALGDGYVEVHAAADRTCGLRADGSLWCWGRGDGTPRVLCVE